MLINPSEASIGWATMVPVIPALGACPAGFAAGSSIVTDQGERPVETLLAGDLLKTATGETCMLRGMSMQRLCHAQVVTVSPGAIGMDWAASQLVVGPGQPLMLANWRTRNLPGGKALVPALKLIGELGVFLREIDEICLYQLHCDGSQVIRACGLDAGTTSIADLRPAHATLH